MDHEVRRAGTHQGYEARDKHVDPIDHAHEDAAYERNEYRKKQYHDKLPKRTTTHKYAIRHAHAEPVRAFAPSLSCYGQTDMMTAMTSIDAR